MNWRNRSVECIGSILFRGGMPPRLSEFAAPLKAARVGGKSVDAEGHHWAAELKHADWGTAKVICLRDMPPPPAFLIDLDPHLNQQERELAKEGGCVVSVVVHGGKNDVLRDRKSLLRFLRVLMADDGLVAMDHTAQRFWSRAGLDDELAHNADLDVESLFTTHIITGELPDGAGEDEEPPALWLHTHGLAEIGFFDFDVLAPHESIMRQGGFDVLRVMAFGILEGKAKPGQEKFGLAGGGGDVRLVDVGRFNRKASANDVGLRIGADESHNTDRIVLCEPPRGFLGKLFDRPRPVRWMQNEVGDGSLLLWFSDSATDLMAERARATWSKFRDWSEELAEFEMPTIAKIGYETDSGGGGREHLWFTVNQAGTSDVEATLDSQPFDIAAMQPGDRRRHSLERMTDWAILTPIGMITPRNTTPLRRIRENLDKFRAAMKEIKALEASE